MFRNTQELCLAAVALGNPGVHDLCISSEIFTPHWGAKWRKWSVTNVALFNAACEGTQHDEKYFQQPDSCPLCSGAYMLTDCPLHALFGTHTELEVYPLCNAWYYCQWTWEEFFSENKMWCLADERRF